MMSVAVSRKIRIVEIINPAKTMLLHNAVLMIPKSTDQIQREGKRQGTEKGKSKDDQRTNDQSIRPAFPVFRETVGSYPGREMMRDRDPQSNRGKCHGWQPKLTAKCKQDCAKWQSYKPDKIAPTTQDVPNLKHVLTIQSSTDASPERATCIIMAARRDRCFLVYSSQQQAINDSSACQSRPVLLRKIQWLVRFHFNGTDEPIEWAHVHWECQDAENDPLSTQRYRYFFRATGSVGG